MNKMFISTSSFCFRRFISGVGFRKQQNLHTFFRKFFPDHHFKKAYRGEGRHNFAPTAPSREKIRLENINAEALYNLFGTNHFMFYIYE